MTGFIYLYICIYMLLNEGIVECKVSDQWIVEFKIIESRGH